MKIVGHRGFPEKFPENSLAGIEAAYAAGAHAVEIDIQFSRDGIPFLCHDPDLRRVTGMPGTLNLYDGEILAKISAHEPARLGLSYLPTPLAPLTEAVAIVQRYPKATFFIEIKEDAFQYFSRGQVVATLGDIVRPIASQCAIISYDLAVLRVARDALSIGTGWVLSNYDANTQLLAADFQPEFLISNTDKLPDAGPLWNGLWEWFVYDITDPEEADAWVQRGVDWIETWNPGILLSPYYSESPEPDVINIMP